MRLDWQYVEDVVAPRAKIRWSKISGVVGGGEQDEFLGNAYALRFPLDWPEPLGSVMIEAQPKLIDAA
jgi:hypothetical protein